MVGCSLIAAGTVLKSVLRTGLHSCGGIHVVRSLHKSALRILMYHSFPADRSGLSRQCEHIRRFYQPVSMRQAGAALKNGEALPKNAIAVTIDDGFRNFLLNGHPVFQAFEIPTTVFLVSDFLDRKKWLWWKEIEYAFEHTSNCNLDMNTGNDRLSLLIASAHDKHQQAHVMCDALKKVSNSDRLEQIGRILDALEVAIPAEIPVEWEPLTWEEVRCLSKENVEFGAHTKTHPILSSIRDREEIREEILGSKVRLEEELGAPVLHFCYPNGKEADIGPEALRITREGDFKTAVTSEPGMDHMGPATDRFKLKRLGVTPDYPVYYFGELLAGVRAT
jgi:peptidoglycan/xylan/chitin deacetylase (PgdA/CDA1 family)